MDLILWRHADAEDGTPDLARKLTPKGVQQARAMAEWLRARVPRKVRMIVSPAQRARQTADALSEDYEVQREIGPDAAYPAILAAAGWPDAGRAVIVVGHQPTLGQTAAFLLSGVAREWSIKKGAVWWLSNRVRGEEAQIVLRAVIAPELL
ncbi:MAG TPA: histidine phosphatase family protein [Burkholderiales bacterium]|jgi:phosphohistidine phosphatase|nr:histidine phosphatase family protein [Burkholderiales bacterium]